MKRIAKSSSAKMSLCGETIMVTTRIATIEPHK